MNQKMLKALGMIAAAEAVAIMPGMVLGDGHIRAASRVVPMRRQGVQECACGRRISANKDSCLACKAKEGA